MQNVEKYDVFSTLNRRFHEKEKQYEKPEKKPRGIELDYVLK